MFHGVSLVHPGGWGEQKMSALLKSGLIWTILVVVFFPNHSLRADTVSAKNLVSENFGDGRQPQVTVAPTGIIIVVFAKDNSIYSVQSADEGKNFSAPSKIAEVDNLMIGMRRGPRIAATEKRVVVSAPGKELFSFLSEDM